MNQYLTMSLAVVVAAVLSACDREPAAPPSQQDGMNAPTSENSQPLPPSRVPATLRLKTQRTAFA